MGDDIVILLTGGVSHIGTHVLMKKMEAGM